MPQTPQARRLKLQCSKTTERYLDIYEDMIMRHGILPKQFQLEAAATYGIPLSADQAEAAEQIDAIRTQCMLRAERRCRKLKMGAVAFSEATDMPVKRIDFWECAIKRKRKLRVKPRLWARKKKAANITMSTKNMTVDEMVQHLKAAKKDSKSHMHSDMPRQSVRCSTRSRKMWQF